MNIITGNRSLLTKEYLQHKVFKDLDEYILFYNSLAWLVMKIISMKSGVLNYDTYLISSIKTTLESIKILLHKGAINDACTLSRKYQDSTVIHIYTLLYLDDNHRMKDEVVQKIYSWLNNSEKLPSYKIMNSYICNYKKLNVVNSFFAKDKKAPIRERLNDHTHLNAFELMVINDPEVHNSKRTQYLNQISTDLKEIFVKHFTQLFTIRDVYMISNDCGDYMDVGETPPEGSQYWVAAPVQHVFNTIIKPYNADLSKILIASTPMNLK